MQAALEQRAARQQVDVGIERQREQHDGAGQAAHVRPQRSFGAREGPQGGLQGAAVLQEIGHRVGQHVGGHGQRQQQGPLEDAPTRKVEQRDGRRGRAAQQGDTEGDADRKQQGGERVARQHRFGLVAQQREAVRLGRQPGPGDAEQRQREQGAQRNGEAPHFSLGPAGRHHRLPGHECERIPFSILSL
jgi:hypothetical protein